MKFAGIKVGDTVYVKETVKESPLGRGEAFFVPVTVERITKTQFIANGNRYKKENGRLIGGGFFDYAYYLGEEIAPQDSVDDQTEAMLEMKEKIKIASRISSIGVVMMNIDYKHARLDEVHGLALKIKDMMEEDK